MTITLPDDVREQAERQVKAAGFASVSDYLADLVREDEDKCPPGRMPFDRERVGRLLDEAVSDGRILADDAFWDEEHRKLIEFAAQREKSA